MNNTLLIMLMLIILVINYIHFTYNNIYVNYIYIYFAIYSFIIRISACPFDYTVYNIHF